MPVCGYCARAARVTARYMILASESLCQLTRDQQNLSVSEQMARNEAWKGRKFLSSWPSPVPVAKHAAGLAAEYVRCRAWLCREVVGVCRGAAVLRLGAGSITSLAHEPAAKGPVLRVGTYEEGVS